MGLFDFFKKPAPKQTVQNSSGQPYKDSATNFIYNLLFCDNIELLKTDQQPPYAYPYDCLFSETATITDLQRIIDDNDSDPRIKMFAYNLQIAGGHKPAGKNLMAVIVEVGLDEGLDVLASFNDGTARYINHTGKLLVWETTTDAKANELQRDLFLKSQQIVNQIGPWDKPRKPQPPKGNTRISFLVSDGLYFGEASTNVLFSDQLASPALTAATQLMKYLTEMSLKSRQS